MSARVLMAAIVLLMLTLPVAGEVGEALDQPTALVLCYHIVSDDPATSMEISRETFRQHLQYLEMTGYNVIPLRDLYEYVSGQRDSIPDNAVVITIDDGWTSAYTEAFPELTKRNFPFTLFIYPKIIGRTPIALNWDQVREMAAAGADIQSHSLSHPYLTRRRHPSLDDAQYAAWLSRELSESRRIIEKETGKPVEFIAYPYGDYDTRVARMAEKAGYRAGLTCDFGSVRRGSNPLRMKRFVIDRGMSFADFRRYLGAEKIMLADMKPAPGDVTDEATVVTARIPDHEQIDPTSVGLALLSAGTVLPYSYDAETGAVGLELPEELSAMRGKVHRAVVWARDAKTGKRLEATWTFRIPDAAPPDAAPQAVAVALPPRPSAGAPSANR
jgi:peptidoglycan/xylan/chitin deacetylase (PgdA/CDA1 family)